MDHTELTRITSDEDWIDLRQGEQALVQGRLYGPLKYGADGMIVSNTAWDVIAIEIPDGYNGPEEPAGRSVTVIVRRNEDGIETTTRDILIKQDGE